jgi:3-mercaptopyruvate sulfurtransferase SseA
MDRERPVAVHCKSGYRSMIACSLLERAGHRNVINVAGGFDAWHAAGLPEVAEQLPRFDSASDYRSERAVPLPYKNCTQRESI